MWRKQRQRVEIRRLGVCVWRLAGRFGKVSWLALGHVHVPCRSWLASRRTFRWASEPELRGKTCLITYRPASRHQETCHRASATRLIQLKHRTGKSAVVQVLCKFPNFVGTFGNLLQGFVQIHFSLTFNFKCLYPDVHVSISTFESPSFWGTHCMPSDMGWTSKVDCVTQVWERRKCRSRKQSQAILPGGLRGVQSRLREVGGVACCCFVHTGLGFV